MSILVVDDSPMQRMTLAAVLQGSGYEDILTAGSASEAHSLLGAGYQIDLILMDLNMPVMNGITACDTIKRVTEYRDIPIIMVTSSDEMADLELAFAAGAMDYIIKPPDEIELVVRVRSALRLKAEIDARKAHEQELVNLNEHLGLVLSDLAEKHQLVQIEQEKSERLLLNILPGPIAEQLKHTPSVIAERFEEVTVLFVDIVDFTCHSSRISPEELVTQLNEIFSLFDALAEKHGMEKIKTVGDAYMAVAGLPMPHPRHAHAAAEMALDIQHELIRRGITLAGDPLEVRIGIHTGPVVAGVIGKSKFSYDLWGDTVNIASRMESHGLAGQIQITEMTHDHLCNEYACQERGTISVKGKGEIMTYLLLGKKEKQILQDLPIYTAP